MDYILGVGLGIIGLSIVFAMLLFEIYDEENGALESYKK